MDELTRIGNELKHAGFNLEPVPEIKSNEDYTQLIGNCVYSICELFYNQGHSGTSAEFVKEMLKKLLIEGKSLSPLTTNPKEWMDISEISGYTLYQSKRNFKCFSEDLTYYYNIEDKDEDNQFTYKKLVQV